MPHLKRGVEVCRLQAEISLLEKQIAKNGSYSVRYQFKCSTTQIDGDDTAWAYDTPKEGKNITFNFKTETPEGVSSGDPFVSIMQPMTPTPNPKPETVTKIARVVTRYYKQQHQMLKENHLLTLWQQ